VAHCPSLSFVCWAGEVVRRLTVCGRHVCWAGEVVHWPSSSFVHLTGELARRLLLSSVHWAGKVATLLLFGCAVVVGGSQGGRHCEGGRGK
jgi:hypothetical protein